MMRFLRTIFLANCLALLATLALLPTQTPAAAAQPGLVTPAFLLYYGDGNNQNIPLFDYRAAINASGTRVVFERSLPISSTAGYSPTIDLYVFDLAYPPPSALAVPRRLVPAHSGTNRPDWCWFDSNPSYDGPIAFSAGGDLEGVYYTTAQPSSGTGYWHVPNTTVNMIYPTWFPGCAQLAVYVSNAIQYQNQFGPEVQKFDLYGNNLGSLSGTKLWAGFPGVNPKTPRLVALAAQQFSATGYQQSMNYIYIANTAGTPPRVTPLDPRAPVNRYNSKFEGRAATYSPDGKWIAFESSRNCPLPTGNPYYAIFLQDAQGQRPARQVTDCGYNAQHAKWYRQPVNGRTLLIIAARLNPTYSGSDQLTLYASGIASLDITEFMRR